MLPPGTVVVLDNGGRDNATVWGDILTEVAHGKGIAGTVIDGINRDVALSLELGYPVYSRDNWMRTGKDRVQVEAVGVAVNIGDVSLSIVGVKLNVSREIKPLIDRSVGDQIGPARRDRAVFVRR